MRRRAYCKYVHGRSHWALCYTMVGQYALPLLKWNAGSSEHALHMRHQQALEYFQVCEQSVAFACRLKKTCII